MRAGSAQRVLHEIGDGIWRLRLPLPWAIDVRPLASASVNVYLVVRDEEFVLVDAGFPSAECWSLFDDAVARLGRSPGEITTIIFTHCHPDHVGLGDRILELAPNARTVMHPRDLWLTSERHRRPAPASAALVAQMEAEGLPPGIHDDPTILELGAGAFADGAPRSTEPTRAGTVTPLRIGDEEWQLVSTPGHTPGSWSLAVADGPLLTGDLLLSGSHVHVGVHPDSSEDPLGEHRASLAWLAESGHATVEPGHGPTIDDAVARARAVARAQERKLGRIRDLLEDGPSTAYDVMTRLWLRGGQDLDLGATRLAMTETVAYLRHLAAAGLVTWDDNGTGVRRWRAVDRAAAEKSTTDKGLT